MFEKYLKELVSRNLDYFVAVALGEEVGPIPTLAPDPVQDIEPGQTQELGDGWIRHRIPRKDDAHAL